MTTPIAVSYSDGRPHREATAPAWAGHGFSRPGPGAEAVTTASEHGIAAERLKWPAAGTRSPTTNPTGCGTC
jgi:hypothetical protein